MQPRVSVVVPAYNVAGCVQRALDSVLAQSWTDLELLVVDDGSTDGTREVLARCADPRLRVLSKPNGGLSSARNHGIAHARGEYLAFLDADDYWLEAKLARQVGLMDRRPDLGFCSTSARVETPEGQTLRPWRCGPIEGAVLEAIFAHNSTVAGSGSGVLARRALFGRVGGFDERLRSLEDIDMWMRLAAVSGYECIDEPLTVIVKHPGSMSRHYRVMRESADRVMRKNRHLLPRAQRGAFWRRAYSTMLTDYSKWAWREGARRDAFGQAALALLYAPLARGRLALGLMLAFARGAAV